MDEKEDLSELSQNELCLEKERQSITISIETFEDQLKSKELEDIEIILDDGESAKSILDSLKTFHSMEIQNSEDESLHKKAILLVLVVAMNTLTWNLQNLEGIQFSHG